jgi:hypothetical protein
VQFWIVNSDWWDEIVVVKVMASVRAKEVGTASIRIVLALPP